MITIIEKIEPIIGNPFPLKICKTTFINPSLSFSAELTIVLVSLIVSDADEISVEIE
jgi:hypothetical protein